MQGVIVFEILSWWHAGTSRGDGLAADAKIARTQEGLPFLGGRTVKGLARHAIHLAVAAEMFTLEQEVTWFGTRLLEGTAEDRERRLDEARYRTREGALVFSSATLGSNWAAWAANNKAAREHLVDTIAGTRIDEHGVAQDKSLRVIEVAVPMTLRANVSGLDPAAKSALEIALPLFLRSLGSHRNRGLGRVAARLEVSHA